LNFRICRPVTCWNAASLYHSQMVISIEAVSSTHQVRNIPTFLPYTTG
jgi:hypothetical protein